MSAIPAPKGPSDAKLVQWKEIAVTVAAVLLAYLPVLKAGFIWDDDDYVTENLTLRTLGGLVRIWTELGAVPQYYPMVHTTFWLEYQMWGLSAVGYHLVNVLLHAANAVVLLAVLRRLGVPGALFAALLFALHPVHVESVAWITERKNCLSGLFYLLSMLYCVDLFGLREGGSFKKGKYALALGLFVLALLSKTVACSLPAAVLLLIYWKRGRLERRDWLMTAPFFAVGFSLACVTVWMERTNVGAGELDLGLSFWDRFLVAGRAVWFYAGKLIWPHPLVFIYPKWTVQDWSGLHALFPISAAMVVAATWYYREKIGRGPLVALLFFGGTLFPALGFVDVYPFMFSYVADHFQYLASIGLLVLLASVSTRLSLKLPRKAALACAGILLIVLGGLTFRQTFIFRDLETLWRDTLAKNPDSWMPLENLGREMVRQERFEEGLGYYLKGVELRPDDHVTRYNLGAVYLQLSNLPEARAQFLKAIELRPDYTDARANLGIVYRREGNPRAAAEQFSKVLELAPDNRRVREALNDTLNAMVNEANAQAAAGRLNEALEMYEYVISARGNDADDRYNYGVLLMRAGRRSEARAQFETAVKLNPRDDAARKMLLELEN